MPVVLPEALEEKWLMNVEDDLDITQIKELIREYPSSELAAFTVGKLRGKEYAGNVITIADHVMYEELVF